MVSGEYAGYEPDKKDVTGKLIKGFVDKVPTLSSYEDAARLVKTMQASDKNFQKLSKTDKDLVLNKLGELVDTIFPPRGANIGIGNY
jgi:hypothetical protein